MHHSDHVKERKAKTVSYLEFYEMANPGHKTRVWNVRSIASVPLGTIKFFPAWRKYVFVPVAVVVLDAVCLQDITEFLKEQTQAWRDSL